MPPYGTQPSSSNSPLKYASVASEFTPLRPRVNAGDAELLEITYDFPRVHLMAADEVLFRVYYDWLHQNISTHLDGGINEDGKWQAMWKMTCLFSNPMLQCTVYPDWDFLSQTLQRRLMAYKLVSGTLSR